MVRARRRAGGVSAAIPPPDRDAPAACVAVLRDGVWVDVRWYAPDDEYVATCREFPGLAWLASTPEEADAGLRRAIAEAREDVAKDTPGAATVGARPHPAGHPKERE